MQSIQDQNQGQRQLTLFEQVKDFGDSSWGCMLRVGQNMLAMALHRHLKKNYAGKKQDLKHIILGFADNDNNDQQYAPYSIQNIVQCAQNEFNMEPGQWYTPNRICYILQQLHKKNSIKGAENLAISVMLSDRPLILKSILQLFCGEDAKICTEQTHQKYNNIKTDINNADKKEDEIEKQYYDQQEAQIVECEEEKMDQNSHQSLIANLKEKKLFTQIVCKHCHKSNKSVLVFIVCKIGLDKPEEKYIKIVNDFMDSRLSIGIIGGKPNKALYFVGRINNSYIYLDPHYVQQATTNININNNDQLNSYFCQNLLTISCDQIDASLAIGLYLENLDEFEFLTELLAIFKNKYKEDFFLWVENEKFEYDNQKKYKMNKQDSQNGEEGFQIVEECQNSQNNEEGFELVEE